MRVLLLGGTADGRKLADRLHREGVAVIYSVAGLVRTPDVNCQVVQGGFSQFGGLVRYIRQQAVTAIVDVTHPYAQNMSRTAVEAAKHCEIPCWRFHRPPWERGEGDNWTFFEDWDALSKTFTSYRSIFLTCGQLTQRQVDLLARENGQRYLLRTAAAPKHTLAGWIKWVKAIGPFALDDESALMQKYSVDVLVSKNSGGDSTVAKLHAARTMGIPVLMLKRPELPDSDLLLSDLTECEARVLSYVQR